ncbi:MAG: hypothetical protein FJ254_08950 [Phycisphaerae bacterium]|nr:hypothetical protein [Phycisphaerae bacterium]
MYRTLSVVVAATLASSASVTFAQYSSDPTVPLAISATAADDVQGKIAAAPNDGQYISYFTGSGYDIYLDRRDHRGNSVWSAPVLIEDRAFSSTTDYAMVSDAAGNAYVVYNAADPANSTGALVKMASVSPTGSIRWTTVLHTSTLGPTSLGNGRAAVASDGFVWGAYSVGNDSVIARVNPTNGSLAVWRYLTENSSTKQICSGLQASTNGGVILSTVRYTTFTSPKTLRARRINADGTYGWGGDVGTPVFTTGSVQFGNFPDFISDGAGGAYFPWYTTSPLNCRVQRIDAAGTVLFGADGTPVSPNTSGTVGGVTTTLNRTNPSAVIGGDGRLYVFYRAYTGTISGSIFYGIGAQCFDSSGNRQWTDDGVMVEDYETSAGGIYDRGVGNACLFGTSAGCSYTNSSSAVNAVAVACRMDAAGTVSWRTTLASNLGTKYRFVASDMTGAAVFAWQGSSGPGNPSDLMAGRVNDDGTLGNSQIPGDLDGNGIVDGGDLGMMIGSWGQCAGCSADLNADGTVDGGDLGVLLGNWTI